MSHPEFAIPSLYDHEEENTRRAPDWGGDELFTSGPRRRRFERSGPHPVRLRETTEHPLRRAALPAPVLRTPEPAPVGRRTVTITGHPGATAVRPRRPARSLDERIARRPERIAAWSFAMGLLLILLAILTAH